MAAEVAAACEHAVGFSRDVIDLAWINMSAESRALAAPGGSTEAIPLLYANDSRRGLS